MTCSILRLIQIGTILVGVGKFGYYDLLALKISQINNDQNLLQFLSINLWIFNINHFKYFTTFVFNTTNSLMNVFVLQNPT